MTRVHTKIVIDMSTYQVLEDEWYEYEGEVAQCKGGGSTSTSKPVPLDSYMTGTLYPKLKEQYAYLSSKYPATRSFDEWLGSNKTQQAGLQSNLTGAQGSLGSLSGLTQSLMTPEAYSASMQPYLTKAYQGIGMSGMPAGSYADKNLAEATQQGYMANLGNILNASQAEQAQRGQIGDIIQAQNTMSGQEYAAKTEPLDFIKQMEALYHSGQIQKSAQSGGGGLLGLFG